MTVEELLFKMGVDSSPLDKGLRQAKVQLQGFKEETEKTFLHAGSAAKAFHKNVEALNEAVPGLGTALQAALNPVTGLLVGIAVGFGYAKKKLEEYNAELDKTAAENAKPVFGQDQVDKLLSKQRELREEQKEWERQLHQGDAIKKLTDRMNEQVTATGKLAEAHKLLPQLLRERAKAEREASDAAEQHAKIQESVTKGPENLKRAQRILEDLRGQGEPQLQQVQAGFGPFAVQQASEDRKKAEADYQNKLRDYNAKLQGAQTRIDEIRKANEEHEIEEKKLAKQLSEYRQTTEKANSAIENVSSESRKLQAEIKKAQDAYNLQIGELLQKRQEQRNQPYQSGSLSELGQMNTPYGQIAREIGLARNTSKFLGAQMSPEEFAAVNAQVIGLQGTARADLSAAGADPHKRAAAIQKYGQGLEDILTKRGQNPEAKHLEEIEKEIKNLNAKAGAEGLVVRGADSSQ